MGWRLCDLPAHDPTDGSRARRRAPLPQALHPRPSLDGFGSCSAVLPPEQQPHSPNHPWRLRFAELRSAWRCREGFPCTRCPRRRAASRARSRSGVHHRVRRRPSCRDSRPRTRPCSHSSNLPRGRTPNRGPRATPRDPCSTRRLRGCPSTSTSCGPRQTRNRLSGTRGRASPASMRRKGRSRSPSSRNPSTKRSSSTHHSGGSTRRNGWSRCRRSSRRSRGRTSPSRLRSPRRLDLERMNRRALRSRLPQRGSLHPPTRRRIGPHRLRRRGRAVLRRSGSFWQWFARCPPRKCSPRCSAWGVPEWSGLGK